VTGQLELRNELDEDAGPRALPEAGADTGSSGNEAGTDAGADRAERLPRDEGRVFVDDVFAEIR
jgi:hypothetical protein